MARPRRLRLSTRARLTAWYAALLVLLLLALGAAINALAENRLTADVDHRLASTAEDIGTVMARNLSNVPFSATRAVRFEAIVPNLGSFASRGLLIQIATPDDEVVRTSEYAPSRPLMPEQEEPGRGPEFVTTTFGDDELRAVRYPLFVTDSEGTNWYIGSVIVGERLTMTHETLASLRQVLLVTSALGLTLAIVGGWVLAGRALRPVDRVTAAAAAIAAGDGTATSLQARLPVPPTNDELSRLSATFNAMLGRLEASFRAQERFVADASHELRTPLTAIRGNVEVLSRQVRAARAGIESSDLADSLDDIKRESDRMRRLLDDLLLLARADAGSDAAPAAGIRQDAVRLETVAAEAARSAEAIGSGQTIELEAPRGVLVRGDPDRLHQLVMILLDNAIRHTPAGGRIRVAVAATPDGNARLAVRDDGEGIAPEHLPHVFERFYRADGARGRSSGGTGLGLAIARAIAQAHGGEIAATSEPGRGATFIVTLPNATPVGIPAESQTNKQPGDTAGPRSREASDQRSTISAAMAPPTITTKAIGKITPMTDSLRKPRP